MTFDSRSGVVVWSCLTSISVLAAGTSVVCTGSRGISIDDGDKSAKMNVSRGLPKIENEGLYHLCQNSRVPLESLIGLLRISFATVKRF